MSNVATAIELAISMLRDIERRAPGTKGFIDYDAFILNELNPALVNARKWEHQLQSMQRIVERHESNQPEAGETDREKYIVALKLAANRMGIDATRLHSEAVRILSEAEHLPQLSEQRSTASVKAKGEA